MDVITHGAYIPIPFLLFTAFSFIVIFGELVASAVTKKNTAFANFSFFSSHKCPTTLSFCITAIAYLSTSLPDFIWHCNTSKIQRQESICFDTYASPSQRKLLRVSEQAQLVILFETTNNPFRSQMFHASKSCEQLKIIKKQTSFRTFGILECLEHSSVWKIQMF